MNKRLTIIVVGFLLIFIPTFFTAGEGSWVDLVYDQEGLPKPGKISKKPLLIVPK